MYLRNRLFFACLLVLVSVFAAKAQTLYWVGGSGNFSDPKHWSAKSGGLPANVVPGPTNDVVIDGAQNFGPVEIYFNQNANFKSLYVRDYVSPVFFRGNAETVMIGGEVQLAPLSRFEFGGKLVFKSISSKRNKIDFGSSKLTADLEFLTGKFDLEALLQAPGHKISFAHGDYHFGTSYLNTDRLEIIGDDSKFKIDTSYFMVNNSVNIPDNTQFTAVGFGFYAPFESKEVNINPGISFGTLSKLSSNNINSICEASLYAYPSCPGSCQGTFSVVIDPACAGSTLDLIVQNAGCAVTASSLSVNNISGTFVVNNVCACASGNFNAVIIDNNFIPIPVTIFVGSTGGGNFNFLQPSSSLITLNQKVPSCSASCDGSLALTISGGNAPFSVQVTGPVATSFTTAGGFPFQSLCGGVYSFTITDKYNCSTPTTKTLTPPPALTPNLTSNSVTCFGSANGSISVAPTGGNPGYTVSFSPGGTFTASSSSTVNLINLGPGVVSLTVTDTKSCTASTSTTIIQPTAFTVTPAQSIINCAGACDGTASILVTGVSGGTGAGSYSYSWSPVTATTSSNGSLCAGPAAVTISDNILGCTTVQNFTITEKPAIAFTSSLVSNVTCNASLTGVFSGNLTGGTPNYSIVLTSPTTTLSQTSAAAVSFTGLAAGSYDLNITDQSNCTKQFSFAITQPPASTLTAITSSNTCPGATAGGATLQPSGGNGAPFTFTWIGGNSATAGGLATGNYTAYASDALGCNTSTISFTIIEPPTFTFGIVSGSVTCNGAATGSITVTASGAANPSYTLTSGAGVVSNTTGVFTNLFGSPSGVGIYTITVNDLNAGGTCAQSATVSIDQPTLALVPIVNFTNVSCFGACNATLNGSNNGGGTPNYTYNWITPTGTILNTQNLTGRCIGSYSLSIVDGKGCSISQTVVTITQPASMTISFNTTSVSCAPGQGASSNGAIATTISGGTGAPSFTWTLPSPAPTSTAQNLTNLVAGVYFLQYTDANNCPQTPVTATILAPTALSLASPTIIPTNCSDACNGTAIISAANGIAPYNYAYTGTTTVSNSTGFFNSVCGPFTVTVTDANTCTIAVSNTVGVPPVIAPNINTVQVTCFGICDGKIITAPSGAPSPFTYTLFGPSSFSTTASSATSATFTSLCAGSYTLLVQANGGTTCAQSFTTQIDQPANSLTATAIASDATCFGVCNGTLSGNAAGGSNTITAYVWTSSTATLSGQTPTTVCANTYTLRVTDTNGCQATVTAVVSEPPSIAITSSAVSNVSCFNGNDGSISVTAGGGPPTGFYSFTWNPSGQTAATATALTAQLYSVTISKNGCPQTFTINVTQPAQIAVSRTATAERCVGACNGSITMVVNSGGVAPFTFSISGAPGGTNTTGVFTGLCPNTYTIFAIDANGCISSTTAVVGTATNVVAMGAITTTASCASCTGRALINASGGATPYSYAYTNSVGVVPALTASLGTGMCPGPYTVQVTDANTCTVSASFTINPVIIIASTVNGTTTCFGASDGAVSVSVTGGNTPYSYTWTPTAQNTPTATGLAAGVYTVRVTDNSSPTNCEAFAQATVIPASSITVAGTVTDVACPGFLTGAITITATGFPPPFTYSWSPSGSTTTLVTGANFGVHTVTVNKGTCSVSATFTVGSPNPPITATINAVNPSNCLTPNNGSITLTAGGGDGINYTYNWSPVAGTASAVTNLTAGAYNVTVTSAGCSTVFASNLTAPLAQTLTPVSSQSVACFSASTGVLTYSTTAPTPSYTWIPATTSVVVGANTTASNLAAGNYTLLLRDINSCTNSVTVNVAQSPSISTTSSQTNVVCFGAATGAAQATVTGGSPAYTYSWSNGTSGTGSIVAANSLTASVTGAVYTATITDAQACTSVIDYTLTSPAPFTFTTNATNISCNGAANGSITVVASPTTGASYSWAAVPSATFAGSTSTAITNLSAGIYSVTVSNGTCNALGTNTVQIIDPGAVTATLSVNHNVTCFAGNNGMATYSVNGGTGVYSYTWTGTTSTVSAVNTATGLTAGAYTVSVADVNGCGTSTTFTITGPTNFNATLTATNPKCTGAFNGSITTAVIGGQGTVAFNWAPAGLGQNPSSLSAGTGSVTYTLTMSDDSLCTVTKTITLIDPLPIGANLSLTSPKCFGVCNGSAQVTPTNAIGTPTITWLPFNTTGSTKTGLCGSPTGSSATIYTVSVVDANGCNVSQSFTLTEPSQIAATYTVAPALCGQNTGSVGITTSGGTGVLTNTWLPPLSGNAATQITLAVGIYSVQISDANACTQIITIPISASNGPTATVNNTSLTCFGNTNASATISAISPTNATIQWLTPLTATTNIVTGLGAGNYSVGITNPTNSCTVFYGFQVSSPPILTAATSSAEPTCFGICDGSVSVIAGGGVTPYNYLWVGPNGFTSTATSIINICGGDYSLTLSDANSCTLQPSFSLPVLNNIIIQQPIRTVNNICFSDCAGSATIDVVSTTTTALTATVSWNFGFFGPIATNLCSGIYSVMVTDTRGCSNTFSVPITSAPDLTLTTAVIQPSCNQCNGGATVTASGGNGPAYTYSWTGGQSTPTLGNVCAGLYQVIVTDVLNCTQIKNLAINNSNGITGETITTQDEQCFGSCNGAATITAIGGTSPISYSWINPSLTNTLNTASNLCPGVYFVQMSDANNCLRTNSLSIGSAIDLTLTTFVTPPSCTAVPADGSIVSNVTGNSGPITYSWAPLSVTTPSLANVGPGSYTLTVTDVLAGCTKTTVVNVSNLAGPQFTLSHTDVDCITKGSASVTTSGTVSLSYLWSTGATGSVVSNLPAGLVNVTVTAGNSCKSISQVSISALPSVQLNSTTRNVICRDDCNGAVLLQGINGTLPYSYSLTGGSTGNQTFSLCSGSYTAFVTDGIGCKDSAVVTIINPPAITFTVNRTNSSCVTLADGSASVAVSAGKAPYKVTFTNGANTFTTNPAAGMSSGVYTVSIIDSLGCIAPTATTSIAPTLTVIANAGQNVSVCPNTDVVINASLSVGADKFMWSTVPTNFTVSTSPSVNVNVLETTNFMLYAESTVQPGCFDTSLVVIHVFERPYLDVGQHSYSMAVYASTVIGGNPTTLASAPQLTWTPLDYLDNANALNPVASNTFDVTYTVTMAYGDGCFESDTVQVLIVPEVRPGNGFSPNGDGKNDLFVIDYIDQFPNNEVEIYNRWGDRLFYSKGYNDPWDGKYKGQPVPVGTYYYVIHLNHFAYKKPITGPVTIFR